MIRLQDTKIFRSQYKLLSSAAEDLSYQLLEKGFWFLQSYEEFSGVVLDDNHDLRGAIDYRESVQLGQTDIGEVKHVLMRQTALRGDCSLAQFMEKQFDSNRLGVVSDYMPSSFVGENAPTNRTPAYKLTSDDLPESNYLSATGKHLTMVVPFLTMGGAEKFDFDLLKQLRERGWEVTLVTTTPLSHSWAKMFYENVSELFVLHGFSRAGLHPQILRYLISSRQSQVVLMTHSFFAYSLLPYLRAHCPEPAFVDYSHIAELVWEKGGYPRKSVEWGRYLDLQIVSSESLKQWMIGQGAKADNIQVAYTCADVNSIRPDPALRAAIRRRANIPENATVILFAGRIVTQKQPEVLIKVLHQVCQSNPDCLALIAGDGADFKIIESHVLKHNLQSQIRLLGEQPNEAVKSLMAASDIFFLPSENEGISLAIYEAMASGLAIVGADVGGQRELVTSDCGCLIPRSSQAAEITDYSRVLSELVRQKELTARMGLNARERVEQHFPMRHLGERMEELLRLVCARHKHRTPLNQKYVRAFLELTLQCEELGQAGQQLCDKAVSAGIDLRSKEDMLEELKKKASMPPKNAALLAQEQQAAVEEIQRLIQEKDTIWERIISLP